MKLFCMIDECPNFIYTKGSVAPFATYTCVVHTPLGLDIVRFQEYQHDPDLDSGSDPLIDAGDETFSINYSHKINSLNPDESLHETDEAELNNDE